MGKTNIKGDLGELMVGAKCLEKGWFISYPFGDDTAYDIIIDIEGVLHKTQVKHVKPTNNTLRVRLKSSTGKPYKENVDLIAIYRSDSSDVYLLNPNDFENESDVFIRLEKPKNNQSKGIIMAEQYKI